MAHKQVDAMMIVNDHRHDVLIRMMGEILGEEIPPRDRHEKWVWARTMVAYQMRKEGYTLMNIAAQMGMHHSAIIHLLNKMQNALDMPIMYQDVLPIWFDFQNKMKNDIYD